VEKPRFKINSSYTSPEDIDYDILGLHKERIIEQGWLTSVKYWKNYDGITYSDLYVHEHRKYNVDGNTGLTITRELKVEWYLTDDTIGYTRTYPLKYYNQTEAIDEGITRRNNVVAGAKVYCINTLGLNYSFDLLNSVKTQLDLFIQGYTQPLRDAIATSTKPYLTQQIKDNIVALLTY
jgi:hypothetical protein